MNVALLWLLVTPKTDADRAKLAHGLEMLRTDDPTIEIMPNTGANVVIGGMGELHLAIVVDLLKHEFGVEANFGQPQIAYKEALTRPADGEMTFAKQVGGRGQYAQCKIHLFPGAPGSGYIFQSAIIDDGIPDQFVTPISEGIKAALSLGVLAGYPIDDVRVQLYDGSYHETDSSELAFRIAGSLAFQDAAKKAAPILLEPVMHLEVIVQQEHRRDEVGALEGRRGRIQSVEDRDGQHVIVALVPLAALFGYSRDLNQRTQGRGAFAMRLDHYQPLPPDEHGDRDAFTGVPRIPSPPLRALSVAVPEPDGDSIED